MHYLCLPPMEQTSQMQHLRLFLMSDTDFKILQANLRKSKDISQSLFNDDALQSYSVILITEPWAKLDNCLTPFSVPCTHMHWQPFFPSNKYTSHDQLRTPVFRSMIWVNKVYTGIQQVELAHPDICAIVLTLGDRKIFLASVYIPCSRGSQIKDDLRLNKRLSMLR